MTAWADTPDTTRQWEAAQAIQGLITESAGLAYEAGMDPEQLLTLIADTLHLVIGTEEGGEI